MATRKSKEIFGLGEGITENDAMITGCRLPTAQQILRCLMYHIKAGSSNKTKKWDCAKLVLSKVVPFYKKANIPMIAPNKACEKMLDLLDKNAKLREIPHNRRVSPAVITKVEEHKKYLSSTFVLWPASASSAVKNQEDAIFLESMKTDRVASFGGLDTVLAAQQKRTENRKTLEKQRHERAQSEMRSLNAKATFMEGCDIEESLSEDGKRQEVMYNPRRQHRRVRTGTKAFIPHNILEAPRLVSLATRIKMTPAQQAAYTEALIEEAGGDSSKVCTSYAYADKARRETNKEIAQTSHDMWKFPKLASLHWDEKMMSALNNQYENDERLVVAIGDSNETKVLGIPAYKPGTGQKTGEIIMNLTHELLVSWNCTDSVRNMVFDTTASNTGHLSGACIKIQQSLGRALLWSACRHHVGEVILTQVFHDLKIEASRSPDVSLFTRLRKNWRIVYDESNGPLNRFDIAEHPENVRDMISEWKDETVQMAGSHLPLVRDDYHEFIQLSAAYLDPEFACPTFRHPAALHRARWMSKVIYSIKISLFEQQIALLPRGTIATMQQLEKIKQFVKFCTLIYCPWWMKCSRATEAPWNDLVLYNNLMKYYDVSPTVADSALKAFNRHLWYLTAELVPLSLFSENVPSDERRLIADKLLSLRPGDKKQTLKGRFGEGFGKPKFPSVVTLETKLADLVTTDSWFFFRVLDLDDDFLSMDVEDWSDSDSYQSSHANVQAINVVNDSAERAIKLGSDFLPSARKEENYQNVVQVVEENRKTLPNLRKRKAEMSTE